MEPKLALLHELMQKHPGDTSLRFEMKLNELSKTVHLDLTDPKGIMPSNDFFEGVHRLFGDTSFIEFN